MSKAAKKTRLEALHEILTETMIAILEESREEGGSIKKDADGKPVIGSAHLNAVRQFLSDNDIEADPDAHSPNGDAFGKLKQSLADLPFDPDKQETEPAKE